MARPRVRPRPPQGLASLVLASTCASLPAFAAETRRLKESLPAEVQEAIDRHEAEGTTDDEAYAEATMAFYTQWVCRLEPVPRPRDASFKNLSEDVYGDDAGAGVERHRQPQGLGRDVRLGELDLPVLVTSGRYDEMAPALVQPLVDGIRRARLRLRGERPPRDGRGTGPLPGSPRIVSKSGGSPRHVIR